MSTLINPTRPSAQAQADFNAQPLYLRNPNTGMIFKLTHKDSIKRCLTEGYTPSSEDEMRQQAIELAQLQGRPLPPWATPAEATDAAKAEPEKSAAPAAKAAAAK